MMRRAAAALLVALALFGAACTEDRAPVRLELSDTHVRPGQLLDLRVIAPGEHSYGIDTILERLGAGGQWAPAYHLGLAEDAHGTGYARYGESWAVRSIGLTGDRWWTIALPGELAPGRYRIAKDVTLGEGMSQTVIRSEELVVTA